MAAGILLSVFTLCSCRSGAASRPAGQTVLELTVDTTIAYQTMHGFGASDAWSTQFVGRNWPAAKKTQIADWLFSTELDDQGNPAGIGLSIWRFNLGAGSAEQGLASGIVDEWRRAESFLQPDGTYDWNAAAGQRWFLQAAASRGVEHFIAFANSPPVAFTRNQRAFAASKQESNLAPEHYTDYAQYLTTVATELEKRDGIRLSAISPFNEPQWDWTDGGQEGNPAWNRDIAAFVRLLDSRLSAAGLSTRIEVPEAAQLNFLYQNHGRPGRGNQAQAFFDPDSAEYIGSLAHIQPTFTAHSYFTTWPLSTLAATRQKAAETLRRLPAPTGGKAPELSISEYCILDKNNEISGPGRDLSMDTALYVSRIIHADLTIANAVAWQWWLAVSPYDYKDGLVYIDRNTHDGAVQDSRLLWALGNFARFIRPGMQRLELQRSDNGRLLQTLEAVMASAWQAPNSGSLVVVLVNYSDQEQKLRLQLPSIAEDSRLQRYLTDSAHSLDRISDLQNGETWLLPARSLVSLVYTPNT